MSENELQYKSTTVRLGCALLFFLALFFLYSFAITLIAVLTEGHGIAGDIIYEILYGLLYAAVFTLPVLFFRLISGGKPQARIYFERRLPRETPLYLFLGVAVILAAAYLNSLLLEVFEYSSFMEEVFVGDEVSANYQVVLAVFTTAVVPAFAEELLFRGLVLTNLLPYGRVTAILGSALLFGMMHQNAGQFLYATVAGLVLGYVYVRTRSIWCCVLLHFVNNFYSVLQSVWWERLSAPAANTVIGISKLLIFSLGILSFVLLLLREKDPKRELRRTGAFLVELEPDRDHAQIELPARRRVRLFFSAPMVIFFVICGVEMLVYVALSAVGGLF